ncbi:DNA repair protein RadC [Akkermansia glycaniphila]|uniref:RadC family protein n=1 Tax=Akkermansia glycaniphila TaxID=1679444 RepID=UPI001C01291C|nr:DNA repair protein RadC [Akkermansia glycaniphila]MBT9450135.1 DNA repair protein RadC [Akkermansia glycaniphila]
MSPSLPATGPLPREKLAASGRAALSDEELIALFLRTGIPGCNVMELSRDLIRKAGSLANLGRMEADDLQSLCKGIGIAKAATLTAAFELGRRAIQEEKAQVSINTAQDVYDYLAPEMLWHVQEHIVVLLLDIRKKLIRKVDLTIGSLTASLIHPRDIFRAAIKHNAHCFILAHNHPSGDPSPSEADRLLTDSVEKAGKFMHIRMIDHVVIGTASATRDQPYYSFRPPSFTAGELADAVYTV